MKRYVNEFLKTYGFPESAVTALNGALESVGEERLVSVCAQYEKGTDFSVLTAQTKALSEDFGVHEYTAKLLVMIALTKGLKERYAAEGLDGAIYVETVKDILYKYRECMNVYGIDGIFAWEWYESILRLKNFTFGRLQFEIKEFRLESYEKDGRTVKQGDTVLSVHIPSSGEPFTSDACEAAYAKARGFFRDRLGFIPPFVCWSWLLYGKNKEFLSPNSNILAFAEKFDVIEEEEYLDEGFNANVAWRIFNLPHIERLQTLPRDTSMQRNVADYLIKGNKLGWGYGIFF